MLRELRLRIGSLRGRRTVVELGEESPSLSEGEISSIERGEFHEL